MYAVILAGGSGTRLWPTSRKKNPKQFHKLIGEKSLFEATLDRIAPIVPISHCFTVTAGDYADILAELVPKIKKNIIREPVGKNTAPAITLAAAVIAKQDEDAIIIVLPSDHYIKNEAAFTEAIKAANKFLQSNPDYIVTLGINPTYPETGYGYIMVGKEIVEAEKKTGDSKIFSVAKFIEKPNSDNAKKFVMTWGYLWNSGIFIFKAKNFLNITKKYLPETYNIIAKIQRNPNSKSYNQVLKDNYSKIEPISIDYGILEKYNKVVVIPVDLGWSDIGNWASLHDLLSDEGSNVIKGSHVGIDTKNCLIHSSKLVATIGLDSFIIIETEDSILICPKSRAQLVKDLLEKLKEDGRNEYL